MKNIKFEPLIWERLQNETRPIVLYGMGDGAEKIYRQCQNYGIAVSDIFASDEYVRGHSFLGYTVRRFSEICEKYEDPIILLCFAAFRPDLLEKIYSISERYTLLAPDVPLFGGGIADDAFLHTHSDEIQRAYDLLADEQSKLVFKNILNFKRSGKIKYLRACETKRDEIFKNIFHFSNKEHYLDLGAYVGDTVNEFIELTQGQYDRIIALEPDKKNYKKLAALCDELQDSRIICYNAGAWDKTGELTFDGRGGRNSHLGEEGYTVPVYAVDELINNTPVTYIKMDVEGAEAEALRGLSQTISSQAPAMAISAYHRTADFFTLPLLVNELNPDYRLFLRHHPYIPAWETNLYALNSHLF